MEPAVRTTNANIKDEVEILIEWCGIVTSLAPWVDETSAVAVREREVATLPQWLVEVGVNHLKKTSVDVGEEVLLAPLHAEGVFLCGESGVKSVSLNVCPPPSIVCRVWTPMQSAGHDVVSALSISPIVTT